MIICLSCSNKALIFSSDQTYLIQLKNRKFFPLELVLLLDNFMQEELQLLELWH